MRRVALIAVLLASMAFTAPAAWATANGPSGAHSASCTQLISAESPYLSDGRVQGRVGFYNSIGCSQELAFYHLEWESCGWAGCRWKLLDSGYLNLFPGANFSVVVSGVCQPGSSQYRTTGSWDGLHYTASQPLRLAC